LGAKFLDALVIAGLARGLHLAEDLAHLPAALAGLTHALAMLGDDLFKLGALLVVELELVGHALHERAKPRPTPLVATPLVATALPLTAHLSSVLRSILGLVLGDSGQDEPCPQQRQYTRQSHFGSPWV